MPLALFAKRARQGQRNRCRLPTPPHIHLKRGARQARVFHVQLARGSCSWDSWSCPSGDRWCWASWRAFATPSSAPPPGPRNSARPSDRPHAQTLHLGRLFCSRRRAPLAVWPSHRGLAATRCADTPPWPCAARPCHGIAGAPLHTVHAVRFDHLNVLHHSLHARL